jgi:hypothetical protein
MYDGVSQTGGRGGLKAVVNNTNQRSLAQGILECHRRC